MDVFHWLAEAQEFQDGPSRICGCCVEIPVETGSDRGLAHFGRWTPNPFIEETAGVTYAFNVLELLDRALRDTRRGLIYYRIFDTITTISGAPSLQFETPDLSKASGTSISETIILFQSAGKARTNSSSILSKSSREGTTEGTYNLLCPTRKYSSHSVHMRH
ncbi:hypothetical protein B0H17DRAFT_1134247 [Mycena rosella]|uniref:Uncharacterized protein n=1 Tax=Mycena rosella TaxID=1033263 RepID=A0AAD7DGY6_MYCRO|nr:hypothetical protein B0H17DRAFT_1134247 [Mycena rosella]